MPQRVHVDYDAPGRAKFVLRPSRSIAGRARVFNRESGQYIVLANATVELLPLQRQSVTDANGQYAFRNLPAGDYTLVATVDGHEQRRAVTVPDGPALMKDIDLALLPGTTTVSVNSPASSASDKPSTPVVASGQIQQGEEDVFTIQIAALANVRLATAMIKELKAAGHAAYLDQVAPSGTRSYRVCVGPYAQVAEAEQSARKLEKTLGWQMSVLPVRAVVMTGVIVADAR